jgi:dCTP deaminase
MILSNIEILRCIKAGHFNISPLAGNDPTKAPFNTSAVDLRLGPQISTLKNRPVAFDLRKPGLASFLAENSENDTLTENRPYKLSHGRFILGQTIERVAFPISSEKGICYSARVEGKSSLARCGIIVHFTAPTIHAGFEGPITLEIINLGTLDFMLYPEMYFCQLIIEQVHGIPVDSPNQFKGQNHPTGIRK